MDPLTIGALALDAGFKAYQGFKQQKMARDLRPSNYVPPAVTEAVANARLGANSTVAPGYGRQVDKLRTSTANTVERLSRATTNPNQIQQGVLDADAREKEILKDMEVNNEAWRAQNRDRLNAALGIQGQYQKQAYDQYNATKSALKGAGMQNLYHSVSGLAEGALYANLFDGSTSNGESSMTGLVGGNGFPDFFGGHNPNLGYPGGIPMVPTFSGQNFNAFNK